MSEEKVVEYCSTVKSECSKGLAEKMLATKNDGYNILVKVALKEDQKKASLEAVKVRIMQKYLQKYLGTLGFLLKEELKD